MTSRVGMGVERMRRLSGTDSLFLAAETASWHQHVGGLTILEPGPNGLDFDDVLRLTSERMDYAPKFKWKLQEAPLGLDRPVWVDDPDFDIHHHVHRIGVPSPGGAKELGEVAGLLLSSQLDRNRPLWEVWMIEGLVGGRVALLMKYHHCLLDGVAGVGLAAAMLDIEPDATAPLIPKPDSKDSVAGDWGVGGVLGGLASRWIRLPLTYTRYGYDMLTKVGTVIDQARHGAALSSAVPRGPKTPFNSSISARRRLAFAGVAFADIDAIKKIHGVKINDVVLALCASALRSYLLTLDVLPDRPLVTAVPVSTRSEGDETQDNQISTVFVELATHVDDPVARLMSIHEASKAAKEMSKALGARQIQSLGEVAAPVVLGTAIRALYETEMISKVRFRINTLVSNVPGPPLQLYMGGAKVTGIYPSSVILEGMGVNFTVLSNMERLDFGLHVDPSLVPDPWEIINGLYEGLSELLAASGLPGPTAVTDPLSAGAPSTSGSGGE
ncbi:wax ester/triacylglycerol synthase family O-acyltransferase [Nocardia sp. 348MFTsu5.1]|uniref:WS/DGAT/MGAT family O-acyltransferase n=1 Tax=Nocardia sp. 348MFTsu5.1 TaxID=1172185 RepID=UPI0003A791D3|nr:wax ester/triacylglycerol synthase family O-acyltransferase [Nocardia sp. 348MFTsu5.1]